MLELKNIRKAFGDCVANEDVSFVVNTGTIHAIVGENGAGKSTAMKIVYGFYNADRGEILLDGNRHTQKTTRPSQPLGRFTAFHAGRHETVRKHHLGAEPTAVNLDWKAAKDIKHFRMT